MAYIRKNIQFLFVFILPVYFCIVQDTIQNKHTHFYPGGIVVTHSHPFDSESEGPIDDHDHTQTEIVLFQQLNIDFFLTAPELVFTNNETVALKSHFITDDKKREHSIVLQPFKRGPPSFFLSFLMAV